MGMQKWIWVVILIVFALIAIPIATLQVGVTVAETDNASTCDLSAGDTAGCAAFGAEITGAIPGLSAVQNIVGMIPLALYAALVLVPVGYLFYKRKGGMG